jgi:tyrosinase
MGIRKDHRTLTQSERVDFINAILTIKRSGEYDGFVRIHNQMMMMDMSPTAARRTGHRCPSFLPWHRKLVLDFERALQRINPSVNVPYWDWTDGFMWDANLMGGDGNPVTGEVTTGPFTGANWPIVESPDMGFRLRRSFGRGPGTSPTLPSSFDRANTLAQTAYDTAPWGAGSISGFRNILEGWQTAGTRGMHNQVHSWIGGHMSTGASPNDPIFWLVHSFLDKTWSDWQNMDWQRKTPQGGYLPVQPTFGVVSLYEPMFPWPTTPAEMLDHSLFYTYA